MPEDRLADSPSFEKDVPGTSPAVPETGAAVPRDGEPTYLRRRGLERLSHGLPRRR